MIGTVKEDGETRYVEVDGRRYDSPELDAPEGTEVEVEPYTGMGDVAMATLTWTVFESTYTVQARKDVFWVPRLID